MQLSAGAAGADETAPGGVTAKDAAETSPMASSREVCLKPGPMGTVQPARNATKSKMVQRIGVRALKKRF